MHLQEEDANEFFIGSCGFFFKAILPLKITCATNSDILMHSVSGAHFKKLLLYKYVLMLFMYRKESNYFLKM